MATQIVALIPAGGVGERAQHMVQGQAVPKQYRQIGSQTMLAHSVRALLSDSRVSQVLIGVAPNDGWIDEVQFGSTLPIEAQTSEKIAESPKGQESSTSDTSRAKISVLRSAGASRAHTVLNTLDMSGLSEEVWVLVHDAARPGLPAEALSHLVDRCLEQDSGGLLALPIGDTVKRAQVKTSTTERNLEEPVVDLTLSREGLWLAQTPQMFRVGELRQALRTALECNLDITDEASAMEFMGTHPLLVKGHWCNLKVTWPSDFDVVEHFL